MPVRSRSHRHNPAPSLGVIEATNPCGDQPLLPYEPCVLGSYNLGRSAAGDGPDWERLGAAIRDAVVFLDNVIEVNCNPLTEIVAATRRTRKVGRRGTPRLSRARGLAK